MFDETKDLPLANDSLKNSTPYREFRAEPEEIPKHAWHECGRVGHDVGFERALADWIIKHRSKWRKSSQPETQLTRLSRS
jgi:hypothetical protein